MEKYFDICMNEAKKSIKHKDIPVGALLVLNDRVIATGHNTREKTNDVLGHAEINVIKKAAKKLGRWNLSGCSLYVTLKPCSMCMEVIKQAKISEVFYILDKPGYKKGFSKTKESKVTSENEQIYAKMMSDFFKEKR